MERTNAIITHRIDIAPGVWIIHVAPDGWDLPEFEAGHSRQQHPLLTLGNGGQPSDRRVKLLLSHSSSKYNHVANVTIKLFREPVEVFVTFRQH